MIKNFYIFRHGETDYNREKRTQGCRIDSDLNQTGVQQARNLIPRLLPLNLQIIYSSPLRRAVDTASIVAQALNLPVKIIPGLREGCYGDAEGLVEEEIAEQFPEVFKQWRSADNLMDIRFPNGESKREMQQRMFSVLEELLDVPYQNIGLASHGGSIRYLLMVFSSQMHHMPNTALFHIRYQDGSWSVENLS